MGLLVDGAWREDASRAKDAHFVRAATAYHNYVTPDGSPGPAGNSLKPVLQRYRAVGAVSWPAPRFPPPPVGPTVQIRDRSGQVKKVRGPASRRPPHSNRGRGLPLRHDGRRRWRLAFAHLGIGCNAQESKHRRREGELFHERFSICHDAWPLPATALIL